MPPLCPDVHRNICTSVHWCLYTSATVGKTFDWWPSPPSAWKRDRDLAPTTKNSPSNRGESLHPLLSLQNCPALPAEVGREGEAAPTSCGAWQMQKRLLLWLVDGIFQPVIHFEHFRCELQRLQKKSSDFGSSLMGGNPTSSKQFFSLGVFWLLFKNQVKGYHTCPEHIPYYEWKANMVFYSQTQLGSGFGTWKCTCVRTRFQRKGWNIASGQKCNFRKLQNQSDTRSTQGPQLFTSE